MTPLPYIVKRPCLTPFGESLNQLSGDLFEYASLVWDMKHRVERTMSSDVEIVEYDYELSRYNAIADLRGIGWKSIEEQMADLEPTDIPEELQELQILNPVTFLQSFTHDPSVGQRIPPQRRTPMTFAKFTSELFEPNIVREVTKRFPEAKASMGDFITATQLEWQNEMVTKANR